MFPTAPAGLKKFSARLAGFLIIALPAILTVILFLKPADIIFPGFENNLTLKSLKAKPFFLISPDEVKKETAEFYPWLKVSRITRNLKRQIVIETVKREGYYYLISGNFCFVCDREGVIMDVDDCALNLPRVYFNNPDLRINDMLNSDDQEILDAVINQFKKSRSELKSLIFMQNYVIAETTGREKIIVPRRKNFDFSRLDSLQMLISRFRIDQSNQSTIDYRFRYPVIRRNDGL